MLGHRHSLPVYAMHTAPIDHDSIQAIQMKSCQRQSRSVREEEKQRNGHAQQLMQRRTDGVFSGRQVFINAALLRKFAAVVASVPFVVPVLPFIFAIARLGAAVFSSSF